MKARWLAFLLVLAIAPGTMEVVELAVHWARYGDVADAAGDKHRTSPLGDDEHGCSGTFHFCNCHGNQSVRTTDPILAVVRLESPPRHDVPAPVGTLQGLPAPMPDLRPPIC